jgi:hypothetical protein
MEHLLKTILGHLPIEEEPRILQRRPDCLGSRPVASSVILAECKGCPMSSP